MEKGVSLANSQGKVQADPQAVVCVHGLWLSGFAMRYWRTHFAGAGYAARSFSYPTVRATLAQNRAALMRFVQALPNQTIHFAGHSLGAVTIVSMLAEAGWSIPGKTLGRIVLAGPPFQGSHAGKALVDKGLGNILAGKPLQDWLAGPRPVVPSHIDLGVIAGDSRLGLGRVLAPRLPKPHDGTVSVAETQVAGAREHLVLPVGHTGLLMSQQVVRHMIRFVDTGSFS